MTTTDQRNAAILNRRVASQLAEALQYEMDRNRETIVPVVRVEVRMFNPDIGATTRWKKGSSGNPGGRPKSRMLSEAFRTRLAEVVPGHPAGRTFAELVAENIVEIACGEGPGAVAAANEIADRIEGRPPQSIQVSDIVADLQRRSDEELRFHLANGRWPTDEELLLLKQPVKPTEM